MSNAPSPDDDRTVIRPDGPDARTGPSPPADATIIQPPAPSARLLKPSTIASSADHSGNALAIGTFLAEFELTRVIGEGGFGIVYQAWDHSLERRVALKEYMPSSLAARSGETTVQVKSGRHRETFEMGRKSFVNEAKLLAQFDHPALVKVYRFWEDNGTAYMVMPLYEGITLKDHLKQLGAAPDEAWLMNLFGPLTEALAVVHTENCFHRDIAPDNVILLANTGRPLLLDFGAARRVIGDMTQALTVILKPGYAPIEQYAEAPHMKQGAWTDIYALAASIHFALVGRTPPQSVSRTMSDTYKPLSEELAGRYSARFLNAIDRALIVKPEERTQSIAALRDDLGLADGQGLPNAMPGGFASPGPSASRERTRGASTSLWIGLGAVALAVAGGGAYFATHPAAPPAGSTEASPAPVPSTTPAPPVVVTPTRFDPVQQLDAVVAGQTAGWQVTAKPSKAVMRIGKDELSFSVTATRAGYLTVLLLGPDDSLIQFFPNSEARDNRIKAGQTIKLPQASWPLEVSEPSGTENFLVIVSRQPRDYSVLGPEATDMFQSLPTGTRADALLAQWRQATPLLLGNSPANCEGADCDAYGAARFSIDVIP
ncbi:MAG: serine/threonine protein kinase [Panacagrimonas sp.]